MIPCLERVLWQSSVLKLSVYIIVHVEWLVNSICGGDATDNHSCGVEGELVKSNVCVGMAAYAMLRCHSATAADDQ